MINGYFSPDQIKDFLNEKLEKYNTQSFIETDPIQIPKQFSNKYDIEISAFLTCTLAWGNRKQIILKANELMQRLDFKPYEFVTSASSTEIKKLESFYYRTFNGSDCIFLVKALKEIYQNQRGLHNIVYSAYKQKHEIFDSLAALKQKIIGINLNHHVSKHVADVTKKAAAKRLNMFLRWMVRSDKSKVDFGIWNDISMADLHIPLDVHTGRVARELGLLLRKQNDWAAVKELTAALRLFDKNDPVKYDYALFGLGVFEKF